MSSSENIEIARAAYRAFNASGTDAILEYLDPSIEWRMWEQFSRDARVYTGHAGVREVLSVFEDNYDEFRADPGEASEIGGRVIVPVKLHGLEKGSGEHQAFELVQCWTVKDGVAVRLDVYSTLADAVEAAERVRESGDAGLDR